MFVLIAALAAFYVTGLYLVVSSMLCKYQWTEDENGQLHYTSQRR